MYLLKPITDRCRAYFDREVPPEMRRGELVYIEFKTFHEVIDALAAAGLKTDRDYTID